MTSRRALVLGGTSFVGRHAVRALLDSGWSVDVFHRGRTAPGLFADENVRHLLGDRDDDVSALSQGSGWDACIDVTAYTPEQVLRTARVLADRVGHYVLVSTVSVYDVPLEAGADESAPLIRRERSELSPGETESYGALKVLAEDAARQAYAGPSVVRPGIVAGPWDPTDRFTSWVRRFAAPGTHAAPALDRPLQWVDARDLGDLLRLLAAGGQDVTVNAVRSPVSLGRLLTITARVCGADPGDVCVRELGASASEQLGEQLAAEGRAAWPMWLPADSPYAGLAQIDGTRANGLGLTYSSVESTVRATFEWLVDEQPAASQGIPVEQEQQMLRSMEAL